MRPPTVTVLYDDAWELAGQLDPESVDCAVTSPPYWGLRSYLPDDHPDKQRELGLEAAPEEYVGKVVDLLARLRPALTDTATVWLNLGMTYATGGGKVGSCPGGGERGRRWSENGPLTQPNRLPLAGYKPKDLVPIPWLVGIALQQDGWWLRSACVWSKSNPLPESVRDRPSLSHEYVLLLTKARRYFFDMEAVKEPLRSGPSDLKKMVEGKERIGGLSRVRDDPKAKASALSNVGRKRGVGDKQAATEALARHGHRYAGFNERWDAAEAAGELPGGRFLRSVWELGTQAYAGAHFATMPPRLAERCILAGCPEGGTVLDPFLGSGTVAEVARRLGRSCIGFELNEEYRPLIEERLAQMVLL